MSTSSVQPPLPVFPHLFTYQSTFKPAHSTLCRIAFSVTPSSLAFTPRLLPWFPSCPSLSRPRRLCLLTPCLSPVRLDFLPGGSGWKVGLLWLAQFVVLYLYADFHIAERLLQRTGILHSPAVGFGCPFCWTNCWTVQALVNYTGTFNLTSSKPVCHWYFLNVKGSQLDKNIIFILIINPVQPWAFSLVSSVVSFGSSDL